MPCLATYSCLVLPRRVVFSFWEVTARMLASDLATLRAMSLRAEKQDDQKLEPSQHHNFR
jgi:hypothetical protein